MTRGDSVYNHSLFFFAIFLARVSKYSALVHYLNLCLHSLLPLVLSFDLLDMPDRGLLANGLEHLYDLSARTARAWSANWGGKWPGCRISGVPLHSRGRSCGHRAGDGVPV